MTRFGTKYTTILAKFTAAKRGNVAILTAALLVPLVFAIGMVVDYSLAKKRQEQITGVADAAALAAVTPTMMTQTTDAAQSKAQAMFNAQMSSISNVNSSPSNFTVTATDASSATGVHRTVTVNYAVSSNNTFGGVLGVNTLPITGSVSAVSSVAPNIDFYLLLDTSPSMEIAATTAGINTMVSNTKPQGGCAFACHETNPSADNLQNAKNVTCTDGTVKFPSGGEDNYALGGCLGVTLRIDLVNQATQNLMTTAQSTATANNTTYRAGIYTIDYNFNTLTTLTNNLSTAQSAASNLKAVTVYDNSCLTKSNCNNDQDSYLDLGLQSVNSVMPAPGNGTNNKGDTPQEVLFIVSDGVIDESLNGSRTMAPINTKASWCSSIKARNIRIAFLYLTYNPLPTNGFYNSNIAPFQSSISTSAQNCASPGLFFEVNTGGDISGAMTALFQTAVATAHLSK